LKRMKPESNCSWFWKISPYRLLMKLEKHLRKMDELKQSVQLAVHEQKTHCLFTSLKLSTYSTV
jgi:hypothetical protein